MCVGSLFFVVDMNDFGSGLIQCYIRLESVSYDCSACSSCRLWASGMWSSGSAAPPLALNIALLSLSRGSPGVNRSSSCRSCCPSRRVCAQTKTPTAMVAKTVASKDDKSR